MKVYPRRSRARAVLTDVVDRTGTAGSVERVRATFEEVQERFAREKLRVGWPITATIVRMPFFGATKSRKGRHELFLSLRALDSGMLDGLIAHESGHMIRTEAAHPSHDPRVYEIIGARVRIPRAGHPVLGEAFNHVQDVYADDLAFRIGIADRAPQFFGDWVDRNVAEPPEKDWADVGRSMSNGFALGTLRRHDLLTPDSDLWDRARAFDAEAGLWAVDVFANFFASLPARVTSDRFVERVETLAAVLRRVAQERSL